MSLGLLLWDNSNRNLTLGFRIRNELIITPLAGCLETICACNKTNTQHAQGETRGNAASIQWVCDKEFRTWITTTDVVIPLTGETEEWGLDWENFEYLYSLNAIYRFRKLCFVLPKTAVCSSTWSMWIDHVWKTTLWLVTWLCSDVSAARITTRSLTLH